MGNEQMPQCPRYRRDHAEQDGGRLLFPCFLAQCHLFPEKGLPNLTLTHSKSTLSKSHKRSLNGD